MIGTSPGRTNGSRSWTGKAVLLAVYLLTASLPRTAAARPQLPERPSHPVAAAGAPAVPTVTPVTLANRVRPVGAAADALLRAGLERSTTFASLLETLDRSDLIVYVVKGSVPGPNSLRFACATGTARFVRITINAQEAEPGLIAGLAHELQHAVEIAGAPGVTDDATMLTFYVENGQEVSPGRYCTREAQRAGRTVQYELCRGGSHRPRTDSKK
jgi:hypothetical protein